MDQSMSTARSWDEMNVDEKLATLWQEIRDHRRQASAVAKSLEELRCRMEQIERRFEELPLS
jgi:phage shock protein A